MKDKNLEKAVEKINEAVENVKELGDEALNKVTGAGDPFASIPRNPTKKIDGELRKKA